MRMERKELPLDEVEAGMVLADELRDPRGTVLLPKGASLTDSVLTSLGRRGIETLPVLVAPTLTDDEEVARRADQMQRLERIFALAGDDLPVRELKQEIALYIQEYR